MNIYSVGFWSTTACARILNTYRVKQYKFCNDINDATIIMIGCFINNNSILKKLNKNSKIFFYISEPYEHTHKKSYDILKLLIGEKYNVTIFGCINNDIINNKIKSPLYMMYFDYKNKSIYNNTNIYAKTCNLRVKKFCALISGHDNGKTREIIFNYLNKICTIDCPGKLLNNMSNDNLNSIGIPCFLKNYIFNLCPVNFKCKEKGYIVEKLLNCCLGGSIPIYFGEIDEIDEQIFNTKRIITYEPTDKISIKNACDIVNNLYNNCDELEKFYRQDIFCDSAYDAMMKMRENVFNL